ncbi:extracellular solute-binding protein [Curtobacterium sp. MCBD17_035]|nr:extracellular solute-binding protein [Curtobacterium sp. MCBD17_035]WIB68311.1 extracellular solute-binding protein [Curtobacterium sp. MCBD17_035]
MHDTDTRAAAEAIGRGISRRTLFRYGGAGVASVALAELLAACSSGSSASSSGTTTVRMWSWYTGQRDVFPKVIAAFEKKHPNIKIQNRIFGTPDQYLPALTAAVSGGDVPEIFAPHVRAITYGEQGISADLRKELGSGFFKDFFSSNNQEYTKNGKQYALGFMAQTFGLFYDPDMLSAAGVDGEPETWDDLIAAAAKIDATGKSTVAFSANPTTSALDFFLPLITQVTDDPTYYLKLDQLEKGYAYTNKPVLEALQLNDRIVKAGVFQKGTTGTSGDQATQLFYTGGCGHAVRRVLDPAVTRAGRPQGVPRQVQDHADPGDQERGPTLDRRPGRSRLGGVRDEQGQGRRDRVPQVHVRAGPVLAAHERLAEHAVDQERRGPRERPAHQAHDVVAPRRLPAHPVRRGIERGR